MTSLPRPQDFPPPPPFSMRIESPAVRIEDLLTVQEWNELQGHINAMVETLGVDQRSALSNLLGRLVDALNDGTIDPIHEED